MRDPEGGPDTVLSTESGSDPPSAQRAWAAVRQPLGALGFLLRRRSIRQAWKPSDPPSSQLCPSASLGHASAHEACHTGAKCEDGRGRPLPRFPVSSSEPPADPHRRTHPRMQMIAAEPSLVKLDKK